MTGSSLLSPKKSSRNLLVAFLPDQLPQNSAPDNRSPENCYPDVALVIDTLRFTSTACVALAAGAQSIVVVSDIEQARKVPNALLCGERACVRIPGFDLGNSPSEYTGQVVAGKDLVFSTTNGTLAVEASLGCKQVILACLLNRRAASNWLNDIALRSANQSATSNLPAGGRTSYTAWCVCSGTDGQIALEDVMTAGAIIDATLQSDPNWQLGNDAATIAYQFWRLSQTGSVTTIVELLRKARGGRNLIDAGFEKDLDSVARLDSLVTVPFLDRSEYPKTECLAPRFVANISRLT